MVRLAFICGTAAIGSGAPPSPRIFEWEQGFGLRVACEPEADMFLWIYEWNMFDAMQRGQHTQGTYQLERRLAADGSEAVVDSPQLHLMMRAVANGAELVLRITNRTDYEWPAVAGIIPCWNPGQVRGADPSVRITFNPNLADASRSKTFYVSAHGLTPLTSRAIHFNTDYRTSAQRAADGRNFVFSEKWPTSNDDATAGLLSRESEDGRWVTGIAWEDFLSVQGHNPRNCMHACVRVGPLKPGESRTIRGRLYLFRGTKEDCLTQFRRDFPNAKSPLNRKP